MAMVPAQDIGAVEMGCVEVRRQLIDYMEGELDLSTLARVVYHVGDCAECKAVFSGVRNVVELLGSSFGEIELPVDLSSRLYARLPWPFNRASSRSGFDS